MMCQVISHLNMALQRLIRAFGNFKNSFVNNIVLFSGLLIKFIVSSLNYYLAAS